MSKKIATGIFSAGLLFPGILFAQTGGFKAVISEVGSLVNLLIPIAFSAAILFFFWGVARFVLHSGDEGTHEEGKQMMLWGIVALFVIVSIWGLVEFIGSEVGVDTLIKFPIPEL